MVEDVEVIAARQLLEDRLASDGLDRSPEVAGLAGLEVPGPAARRKGVLAFGPISEGLHQVTSERTLKRASRYSRLSTTSRKWRAACQTSSWLR